MKIVVIGTRGIPDILGGVETHCQELYPRLARLGNDVTIIRRSCYVTEKNKVSQYQGVKLIDLYAPRMKSVEAVFHTFLAVLKARSINPDILHIHAIGPSLMTPFARLLGLNVVTTNHGPDYDRKKWGRLAKMMLKAGEWAGAKFSNKVIVISQVIADILAKKYGRTDTELIYNGVPTPNFIDAGNYSKSLGLKSKHYILALGRFVKEKNFDQLIDAWKKIPSKASYQLVIAGDADHDDDYSAMLKRKAKESGVVLTGFIKGNPLYELLSNAALFVLPSSHEGLPISLLEAMSYGLPVVVSDIAANKLPQLCADNFFEVGNIEAMAKAIEHKINSEEHPKYDLSPYNWDNIARQTENLYKSVLKAKQ